MLSKERKHCVVLWAAHLMWTLGERPQKKEENRPEPSNETAEYMHVPTQGWHQTLNWFCCCGWGGQGVGNKVWTSVVVVVVMVAVEVEIYP